MNFQSRRYFPYSQQLKSKYGGRIQKVSIHAEFTCPNRDGSLGYGGCTFCNNDSFVPNYLHDGMMSITKQIDHGMEFLPGRYHSAKAFVGYFQAYSNTYGTLEYLKEIYSEALNHPKIDGLVIGTRPDCLSDEQLDYLEELSKEHLIFIEFGIESCYNKTLDRVNRGHSFEDSVEAIQKVVDRGISVAGHMLFGLPGETREETLAQAEILNKLPLESLKFHQLQIVKGTIMAKQFKEDPSQFPLFQPDEYVDFMVDFLERLRPDIAIQRFSSDTPINLRIAPNWGIRPNQIQLMIEKRLKERDTYQGALYQEV
ncbi:TIGR01212 family radical SAM protein [Flammeovirga sp. SJP92]|uniref:TIGR01212 family radical SAM protein n=1 Tax=Flammeovirga sp. SJP92 TaxID=1775430 RepID=UPI000786BBFB|nr:TIGR01212 family radical SAM protein [Flammeovirga sp. SJP92]KXX72157.1 radical SAM protein [Flammeovirga sp. SJP92]